MADLPTDSKSPTPVLTTDAAVVSGQTNVVRFSARVKKFFDALSPSTGSVYDTGWIAPTLATGTAGNGFGIRRIGKRVFMRGTVAPATNWGTMGSTTTLVAAGGIPADMRPPANQAFLCGNMTTSSAPNFRVVLTSDGALSVQPSIATSTTTCWFTGVDTTVD